MNVESRLSRFYVRFRSLYNLSAGKCAFYIYSVGYAILWLSWTAFLGKEQKSFCTVIPMNAHMCMLNLWTIEFAAAGNQKSMETHDAFTKNASRFYVFFTFFHHSFLYLC